MSRALASSSVNNEGLRSFSASFSVAVEVILMKVTCTGSRTEVVSFECRLVFVLARPSKLKSPHFEPIGVREIPPRLTAKKSFSEVVVSVETRLPS